jgi:hypothetical protein
MALANDVQQPLDQLAEEENDVRNTLAEAHDAERIEFRSLGSATLEKIYQDISQRSNRKIAIFHYSGHSNGDGLHLEDTTAKKESLATLLGSAPNLKLVFLNGCANYGQVKVLHESGVPAVVATSVPIQDAKARIFAKQFYAALTGGQSIQSAYDIAVSFLQNDHTDLTFATTKLPTRGAEWEYNDDIDFPWGLYFREDADLNWHLPLPEQLDETHAKPLTTLSGADFQLDETVAKPTTTLGAADTAVTAIDLETNDRRVQNFNGTVRIQSDEVWLGRHPSCQIVILDGGVSRRHARIYRQGTQLFLSDENSTNGTYWNGRRISLMPLTEDGVFRLDEVEFRVRVIK